MTPEFTQNELNYVLQKLEQTPLANLKEANALAGVAKRLQAFVVHYLETPQPPEKDVNG